MRPPFPWLVAIVLLLFLGDTIHGVHAVPVASAAPLFRFVNHLNQLVWVVVFQRVDNVDYAYVRAWLVSSVGAQGGSLTIPQVLGNDLNVTAQHDATTAHTNSPARNNGGAFVVRVEDSGGFSLYPNSTSGKTLLLNVLDNSKKWDIKFLLSKADSTVVPTAITSWAGDRKPSDMINISLPYNIFFVAVYLTESQVPKQGDNIPFSSLDLHFVRDVYTHAGQEPVVDLVYYEDSWYLNVSNSYCAQQQECKACLEEGNTPCGWCATTQICAGTVSSFMCPAAQWITGTSDNCRPGPSCEVACVHGSCPTDPKECVCDPGYAGASCDTPVCDPQCMHGMCTAPNRCTCDAGWKGDQCSDAICSQDCGHGHCSAPDKCTCDSGWQGPDCSQVKCNVDCDHGICTTPNGVCQCEDGWLGDACNIHRSVETINLIAIIMGFILPWLLTIFLTCCGLLFKGMSTVGWSAALKLLMFLQLFALPLTVNRPFQKATQGIYDKWNIVLFAHSSSAQELSFLHFGNNLALKAMVVLLIIVLLLLVRLIPRFRGIAIGPKVLRSEGLWLVAVKATAIPLVSSLLVGTIDLYYNVSQTGSIIYTTILSTFVIISLLAVDIFWAYPRIKHYATIAPAGLGWKSFARLRCGKRPDEPQKSQNRGYCPFVGVLLNPKPSTNDRLEEPNCMVRYEDVEDIDATGRFFATYGTLVEGFTSYKTGFRGYFAHRFGLIQLHYMVLFTVVSIAFWRSEWAIIALLALQCGYLFFVCLVMPCTTYASFWVEVLQSLTLITEMALVFVFIGNPQFPLLLVISLLPIVMMLVCLVLVPLIASFIHFKQEDDGLYLPINDPPSSEE